MIGFKGGKKKKGKVAEAGLNLIKACSEEPQDVVKISELLESFPKAVEFKDNEGRTALHWCCCKRANLELVEYLSNLYSDGLKEPAKNGMLPLHYACREQAPADVIQYLVKSYPDALLMSSSGWYPAHYACARIKNGQLVILILDMNPEVVRMRTPEGRLPIHYAAGHQSSLELMSRLATLAPETVREGDRHEWTPLHLACAYNPHLPVIDFLIQQYKPGVLNRGEAGRMSLHIACFMQRRIDIIKHIVKQWPSGVKQLDENKLLPLHTACLAGCSIEVIKFLIRVWPQSAMELGKTPSAITDYALQKQNASQATFHEFEEWIVRILSGLEAKSSKGHSQRDTHMELHTEQGGSKQRHRVHSSERCEERKPNSVSKLIGERYEERKPISVSKPIGEQYEERKPISVSKPIGEQYEEKKPNSVSKPNGEQYEETNLSKPIGEQFEERKPNSVSEPISEQYEPNSVSTPVGEQREERKPNSESKLIGEQDKERNPNALSKSIGEQSDPKLETTSEPIPQEVIAIVGDNLHQACEHPQSMEEIKGLVEGCTPSVKCPTHNGNLPLHTACLNRAGKDIIEYLAKHFPPALQRCDHGGNLPLHMACYSSAPYESIEYLVNEWPQALLAENNEKLTPLMKARQPFYEAPNNDVVAMLEKQTSIQQEEENIAKEERDKKQNPSLDRFDGLGRHQSTMIDWPSDDESEDERKPAAHPTLLEANQAMSSFYRAAVAAAERDDGSFTGLSGTLPDDFEELKEPDSPAIGAEITSLYAGECPTRNHEGCLHADSDLGEKNAAVQMKKNKPELSSFYQDALRNVRASGDIDACIVNDIQGTTSSSSAQKKPGIQYVEEPAVNVESIMYQMEYGDYPRPNKR